LSKNFDCLQFAEDLSAEAIIINFCFGSLFACRLTDIVVPIVDGHIDLSNVLVFFIPLYFCMLSCQDTEVEDITGAG
jgi:hypothetical protein